MYFDAVITPAIVGSAPSSTTGRKKLTKAKSQHNDTDQASTSRLIHGRAHTASSYSQPVPLSPPPQPRRRSRSITPSRPSSIKKKKSMSFVSLFFNRNTQPPSSNNRLSEEKGVNPIKRSESTVEIGYQASLPSRRRTHRLSRSVSSRLGDYHPNGQEKLHPLALFTPAFPALFGFTPSPTTLKRFEDLAKRSNESCANISSVESPNPAVRQGVDGKSSNNPSWPTVDVTDTDAFHCDDDACSTISSICFADDPDEKPPHKATVDVPIDTDSPRPRLNRDSYVLDISAENRVLAQLEDPREREGREKEDEGDIVHTHRRTYTKGTDKLFRILGEAPQQHPQTFQRRHSCSTTSPSPPHSRWSSDGSPSSDRPPFWSLPDVPTVSPLSMPTTFVPPTTSLPSTSPPSSPNPTRRKRRSTLLLPSIAGLTTFLRPSETADAKHSSRPFRSSTFSSTPLSPRFVLSVPPTPTPWAIPPHSHPSFPPGLDGTIQSESRTEEQDVEAEGEGGKGKCRDYRNSVMTEESTFSDLHRLPPELLDDSLDNQSIVFNTCPSTPTLPSHTSPPLSASSTSESSTQSPTLSFSSTKHILHSSTSISRSDAPSPARTSTPTNPPSHTAPSLLSSPRSIMPIRHATHPPPQRAKNSFPSLSSLSQVSLRTAPGTLTGTELVIDPVNSPFDPAVSPIVFASDDGDEYSYDPYLGDFVDEDPVDIGNWRSQVDLEHTPVLESEEVKTEDREARGAGVEAKRKQRMVENRGWSSVRVPLRKGKNGQDGAVATDGKRETTNWIGEWNIDMKNVIQQLRTLR